MLRVTLSRLLTQIEELATFGSGPDGGVTRFSLSREYLEARTWLEKQMIACGLLCRVDAAGNLIGRSSKGAGSTVVVGSHIDTAPSGGKLDGAYGVLAGLECFRTLTEAQFTFTRPLEVCCFLDEHGRFLDCLGSKAMTGQLSHAEFDAARSPDGATVAEAFVRAGLDPSGAFRVVRSPSEISAYLELHIEQGPVLEEAGVAIGVVDRIAAILRRDFEFKGIRNHAGQTPLKSRRDAMRAACELVVGSFDQAERLGNPHIRMNFGMIECLRGATSTIPGHVRIRQEIRDPDPQRVARLAATSDELARRSADRHGLELTTTIVGQIDETVLSGAIAERIISATRLLGLEHRVMPSGTGHDAQVMAKHVPTGLIFVPSRAGRSHCPEEHTEPAHLEAGANVLLNVLVGLLA